MKSVRNISVADAPTSIHDLVPGLVDAMGDHECIRDHAAAVVELLDLGISAR
jgi:hypothetical protein